MSSRVVHEPTILITSDSTTYPGLKYLETISPCTTPKEIVSLEFDMFARECSVPKGK
jgi:hypothetical protein